MSILVDRIGALVGAIVSPQFVGRTVELARLDQAMLSAAEGRASTIVIGGDSGVGKTRLVTEFLHHARDQGAQILAGGCIQCGDGGPPYWPFIEALRRLLQESETDAPAAEYVAAAVQPFRRELARLLPELDRGLIPIHGADPPSAPPYAAVLGFLSQLAQRKPLVIVVEDLQWADRSTQDLLSFILTNLGFHRILLISTYRSESLVQGHSLRPLLAELLRNRRAEFIDLAPFTRHELATQLNAILGVSPKAELVDAIWARSEGNAFFAEELLAAGCSQGTKLPVTLSQLLLSRVDVVSATARAVLRIIATGGQGVGHGLLATVVGVPVGLAERELLDAIRECVAHQLLIADAENDSYRFRHALLQEAMYDDLLPGERTRFHADYARALGGDSPVEDLATASRLAYHWDRAGDPKQALSAAVSAADAAATVYGFAEAHQHLERALELWNLVPEPHMHLGLDHLQLVERAAEAANMAGNHRRASILLRDAMASLSHDIDTTRLALTHQHLGRYLWASGDSEAALVAYCTAVEQIASATGTVEWARIVAAYAETLMRAGRYRESCQHAEAALAVARKLDARADEGHILATLGFDLAFLGDPAGGIAQLEESLVVAKSLGNPSDVGRAYLNLAELLSGPLNRLAEGAAVAADGVVQIRRLGLERSYGVSLLAIGVNTLFRLGRWPDADAFLRQALELRPTGAAAIELVLARARLSVGRGDFDAARADLDEATLLCERDIDPRHQAPLLTLTAGLALWEGRLGDARKAVARGLAHASGSEDTWVAAPLVWHGLRTEGDAAELARDHRRPDEVAEARLAGQALLAQVANLADRSSKWAPPVRQAIAAYALMCNAEFARLEGASSPDAWGQAADIWEGLGQPYPVSYARWREAEALLGQRTRSSRAAEILRSAYLIATGLSATPLSTKIELLAERARIQLGDTSGIATTLDGVVVPITEVPVALALLTKRERHVLVLVTQGQTNRQIAETLYISDKTASVHVSHILAKLGVTSRVQAAAIAHRLGLETLE